MSAVPEERGRLSSADAVGGLLAAASIFVGAIGVAHDPVRLIPVSIVLALVAVRMTDRHRRIATWAVGLNVVWWVLGMTVAIITEHPLY